MFQSLVRFAYKGEVLVNPLETHERKSVLFHWFSAASCLLRPEVVRSNTVGSPLGGAPIGVRSNTVGSPLGGAGAVELCKYSGILQLSAKGRRIATPVTSVTGSQ